ncbi:methyltransferase domain-containing protein [Lederbergia citrea]|uniref:methyltransferase domain-containing protein n=1 Tax=Lederbergia citrea TaxID=2833581 RepID=UPI001BC98406|nr:methyltransferase domain-containing protein [Lederbergia citrea]MBS4177450.1 methyltransferase domain-containing protein [Lederbergia citrea]
MGETVSKNTWDSALYDEKINFVSQLGKGVVDLLDPQKGERILDLGCGTGDLTNEIAKSGAIPLGIDLSEQMIETAKVKFPDIEFSVENAVSFKSSQKFDAVFSNAALHWMKQAAEVAETIWEVLNPGGRFVAEFGGKGNVATIIRGVDVALAKKGISAEDRNPWYYPSIGEYSSLLENQGFRVTYALHFDRLTPLNDGENGLKHWLDMFSDDFFYDFNSAEKLAMYEKIMADLKPELYKDGTWYADYKRIRVVAVKE